MRHTVVAQRKSLTVQTTDYKMVDDYHQHTNQAQQLGIGVPYSGIGFHNLPGVTDCKDTKKDKITGIFNKTIRNNLYIRK